MVTVNTGQPSIGVDYQKDSKFNYVIVLKQLQFASKSIPIKRFVHLHGESWVVWEEEEVNQMKIYSLRWQKKTPMDSMTFKISEKPSLNSVIWKVIVI